MEGTVSGVNLSNVSIVGTGTFALQEQTGGTATATNVTATGVAQANAGNAPSYSCEGGNFTLTDGGGNSGITPTQCGPWPAPVYPPYPNSGVTVAPTALNFGSVATGTTSTAQTVTVSNPTSAAAPVSSIAVTGAFAETSTCGTSIAAGGSCTVSVTFKPTAAGSATGSLTVSAGGTTTAVSLSGTGTSATGGGATLTAYAGDAGLRQRRRPARPAPRRPSRSRTPAPRPRRSPRSPRRLLRGDRHLRQLDRGGRVLHGQRDVQAHRGRRRLGSLTVASNASNPSLTVALSGTGTSGGSGGPVNLALNAPATASSYTQNYVPANAVDGNASTYWEGTNGAWPTTYTVNLGADDSLVVAGARPAAVVRVGYPHADAVGARVG